MSFFHEKKVTGKDVLRAAIAWKRNTGYTGNVTFSAETNRFIAVLEAYELQAIAVQVDNEIFEESPE
jgi:hypothetical protein